MAESILRVFNTGITYKLFDMPSRVKIIVTDPPKMCQQQLDQLDELGCDIRINVKDQTLYVGLPKRRKRKREETPVKYTGSLDKRYAVGHGERILRYLLAVPDLCDFDVKTEQVGSTTRLHCVNVECVAYAIVKHACKSNAVVCDFPNNRLEFTLKSVH